VTWRSVGVFSSGIAKIPHIATLLGAERVVLRPSDAEARDLDAVVGWGNKPNTRRARAFATRHGIPYWSAEDGFLRSVGLGALGDPPLSIVLDDLGIYYDATRESRLERLLATAEEGDLGALLDRARRALGTIRAAGLSKYNDAPPGEVDLGPDRPRVLVVDQTRGDLSIAGALADEASFDAMLAAAVKENPGAEVVVKTHPDVLAGKKTGYFGPRPGVRLFTDRVSPSALLAKVDRVYAVSSQLGFEALLAGKPVTCFGAPWYSGWGLTDDRMGVPRRGRVRSLEEVFAAAYLRYARYLDPETGAAGTLEAVIQHLARQREAFAANRGTFVCFGFRFWKRNYVRAYLRSPGNRVVFANRATDAEAAGEDARIVVWGQRESAEVRSVAARRGIPIWRVEDGFLRSVGLGSDLTTPASLVFDRRGIYYDPSAPSDLEAILETTDFAATEIDRARALRARIVESGVSKYNLGGELLLPRHQGRLVLLVPGQVEDDASIRLGTVDVRTNLDLLRAARAARPDALVVYKPHPDVLAGNRAGRIDDEAVRAVCDHVETGASLARCLEAADEVHTMTSLVGFEALLRGKRVVVYGIPFYAGWGLTEDRHPALRRTRRLTIDELVCGVLLRYPRYLDRTTGRFTTPEATIARLLVERDANGTKLEVSWLRRQLRKAVHAYREVVHAP
jgi:capsular polysaccharide export protein